MTAEPILQRNGTRPKCKGRGSALSPVRSGIPNASSRPSTSHSWRKKKLFSSWNSRSELSFFGGAFPLFGWGALPPPSSPGAVPGGLSDRSRKARKESVQPPAQPAPPAAPRGFRPGSWQLCASASPVTTAKGLIDILDPRLFASAKNTDFCPLLCKRIGARDSVGKAPTELLAAPGYLQDEDLMETLDAGLSGNIVVNDRKAEIWSKKQRENGPRRGRRRNRAEARSEPAAPASKHRLPRRSRWREGLGRSLQRGRAPSCRQSRGLRCPLYRDRRPPRPDAGRCRRGG